MNTSKTIFRLVVALLFIGICLYIKCCTHRAPSAPLTTAEHLQKEAELAQEFYQDEIKRLGLVNDSLLCVIHNQKSQLAEKRQDTRLLGIKISSRISAPLTDTADLSKQYDTLKTDISKYIDEVAQQELLCDRVIENLEQVIQVKDTALAVSDRTILTLVEINNQSIQAQKDLERKLKRKTLANRIWKTTAFILAGTVTTLLVLK